MVSLKCPNCKGKLGFAKDACKGTAPIKGTTCGHCKHKIAAGTRLAKFETGKWVNDGRWF